MDTQALRHILLTCSGSTQASGPRESCSKGRGSGAYSSAEYGDESDLVDAFVACGGNADKSGSVETEKLVKIIKDDFGLTIDIPNF